MFLVLSKKNPPYPDCCDYSRLTLTSKHCVVNVNNRSVIVDVNHVNNHRSRGRLKRKNVNER